MMHHRRFSVVVPIATREYKLEVSPVRFCFTIVRSDDRAIMRQEVEKDIYRGRVTDEMGVSAEHDQRIPSHSTRRATTKDGYRHCASCVDCLVAGAQLSRVTSSGRALARAGIDVAELAGVVQEAVCCAKREEVRMTPLFVSAPKKRQKPSVVGGIRTHALSY